MKTVFDAVNELKGDLNNAIGGYWGNELYLRALNNGGGIVILCAPDVSDTSGICTVNDFYKCVQEMKDWQPPIPTETPEEKEYFDKMNAHDIKPIFTQAMADAGELPEVGSCFVTDVNQGMPMTCLYSSKFCVIGLLGGVGVEAVFNLHLPDIKYTFKPIPTERDKAIDAMYFDVAGDIASHDEMMDDDVYSSCAALYDAGYRKESK